MPEPAPADAAPFADWSAAARSSLSALHRSVGLESWAITLVRDDVQVVVLSYPDDGPAIGTAVPWERSFCRAMVRGEAPRVATVAAAVPAYRDLITGSGARVAAYLGVPLVNRGQQVVGTLCGTSARAQPLGLARHLPLVELVVRLLSSLLPADGSIPLADGDAVSAVAVPPDGGSGPAWITATSC